MINTLTGYDLRGSHHALGALNLELILLLGRQRGTTHYVDSNVSGGAGDGTSWADARTTIVAAVANCAADDTIFVAPGHVETLTDANVLNLTVAGLTLIGFGNGNRRPQISLTASADAEVTVDAAGITLVNFRITGDVDALSTPFDINAADCTLIDCITEDVTGQIEDVFFVSTGAHRCRFIRPTHRGAAAAGGVTWITVSAADNVTIEDPQADGNFSTACVRNTSAAANLKIYGGMRRPGHLRTRNAADIIATLHASTTADVGPGLYMRLADNATNVTECLVAAAGQFWEPLEIVNADGESSTNYDATATSDAIV